MTLQCNWKSFWKPNGKPCWIARASCVVAVVRGRAPGAYVTGGTGVLWERRAAARSGVSRERSPGHCVHVLYRTATAGKAIFTRETIVTGRAVSARTAANQQLSLDTSLTLDNTHGKRRLHALHCWPRSAQNHLASTLLYNLLYNTLDVAPATIHAPPMLLTFRFQTTFSGISLSYTYLAYLMNNECTRVSEEPKVHQLRRSCETKRPGII